MPIHCQVSTKHSRLRIASTSTTGQQPLCPVHTLHILATMLPPDASRRYDVPRWHHGLTAHAECPHLLAGAWVKLDDAVHLVLRRLCW